MMLFSAKGLHKSFGGVRAVRDVSFEIPENAVFAIIGPNGAGKSTMLNLISGVYQPDSGALNFAGTDLGGLPAHRRVRLGIARTFQKIRLFKQLSVLENVVAGFHIHHDIPAWQYLIHGPAFARVCREHGIDARAAGLPAGGPAGGPHPVLRRITRLLALAESPNLHEAEAAMNEARRLMLLHNVDASATASTEGYGYRHVGPVKARTEISERILAGILGRHFFVSVIWIPSYLAEAGRRGHVLELCGTPANLEVAEYVYSFLSETAQRLWREHKSARGIRSDQDRRRFCAGVMAGFDEKLRAGERVSQSQGLVRHADAQREAYLRRRYPRRTTRSASAISRTAAYEQGRAAGGRVELHRPVGCSPVETRLLPPPRP